MRPGVAQLLQYLRAYLPHLTKTGKKISQIGPKSSTRSAAKVIKTFRKISGRNPSTNISLIRTESSLKDFYKILRHGGGTTEELAAVRSLWELKKASPGVATSELLARNSRLAGDVKGALRKVDSIKENLRVAGGDRAWTKLNPKEWRDKRLIRRLDDENARLEWARKKLGQKEFLNDPTLWN